MENFVQKHQVNADKLSVLAYFSCTPCKQRDAAQRAHVIPTDTVSTV